MIVAGMLTTLTSGRGRGWSWAKKVHGWFWVAFGRRFLIVRDYVFRWILSLVGEGFNEVLYRCLERVKWWLKGVVSW